MDKSKQKRLEAAGWHAGTTSEFLELTAADSSVTVDLLVKSLLSVGASTKDVGRVIAAV